MKHDSCVDRPHDASAWAGVAVTATSAGGKTKQEDAHGHLIGRDLAIVAVADGVSSTPAAHRASNAAIAEVLGSVGWIQDRRGRVTHDVIERLFADVQRRILTRTTSSGNGHDGPATTLIIALDLDDRMVIAYAGDGAAVLSTGRLQWFTNVLHPQTGRGGALVNYLGWGIKTPMPAIIEIPKVHDDGLVLLIGTDGALELGNVIATTEGVLADVTTLPASCLQFELAQAAMTVLETWVNRLSTDDNRTFGLLLSPEAVRFWRERRA